MARALSIKKCVPALAVLLVAVPGYLHSQEVRKIKDIVIYEDARFYSTFPSAIKRPDGELIVAFRRAPERRIFRENVISHIDPNSYLVMVRSSDGENWEAEPSLIFAHPFGGSQDPCLLQLNDGGILCASYLWNILRESGIENLRQPVFREGNAVFSGGYLVRSEDGGATWLGPLPTVSIPPEKKYDAFGQPLQAYNRGALCQTKDGRILWAVASSDPGANGGNTSVHLISSPDNGHTWEYVSPIAADDKAAFNETSVYETAKGDVVAFLRTANFDDFACIARSTDGGRTFGQWESMGFKGHPLNALRLPDGRVLLVYGYRHKPFGVRARVLNAECTDYDTAEEIVLRDDGGNGDIGYPWPVLTQDGRILVVYYFNKDNSTRHIAGTLLEIVPEK